MNNIKSNQTKTDIISEMKSYWKIFDYNMNIELKMLKKQINSTLIVWNVTEEIP